MKVNQIAKYFASLAACAAIAAFCLSVPAPAHALTPTEIASFHGPNGNFPTSEVSFDSAGNAFGTTEQGGSSNDGTVWEIAAGQTALKVIATFHGSNGLNPFSGVLIDSHNNLFGTANIGGANYYGVVWEIPASTLKSGSPLLYVIANFDFTDGAEPFSGISEDSSGDFFGTCAYGGSNNFGTVWELKAGTWSTSSPGTPTLLATFQVSNGAYPYSGATIDEYGNLLGTAQGGGNNDGVVWEIPASTLQSGSPWLYDIATFDGSNGSGPGAGATAYDGEIFGTTKSGGTSNLGVVWEISVPDGNGDHGSLSVVANFDNDNTNGGGPYSGLIVDNYGDLWGTTDSVPDDGGIWVLPLEYSDAGASYPGTPTIMASFDGTNGSGPNTLRIDSKGNFWGTCSAGGGSTNDGDVWELADGGFREVAGPPQ